MLDIQKLFINYNYSVRNEVIKYIVIHDVGGVSTAKNNREYFNGGNRNASADFFIDSKDIIQTVDYTKNNSWAVGDGHGAYGITNKNSISIEMCLEPNLKPSATTIQNTINVVQKLMKELNIPIERVVRHYDASRKICPRSFSADNWNLWNEFKKQLIPQVVKPVVKTPTSGVVTADVLNVRSGPGTNYEIIGKLNKGAKVKIASKKGNWYDIYFGNHGGYVSADYIK